MIGDTFNADSRIEHMTRVRGVSAAVSQEVIDAAGGLHLVARRERPVTLWTLGSAGL